MKKRMCMLVAAIMVMGSVSSASAATTLKKLARSPFYKQGVSSAADLKNLVKDRSSDLQAGFAKAGYPDLYPAFMAQFPTALISSVKVAPGETFKWMLFKKKKNSRVAVLKDVTWGGPVPFDAYRFDVDKDGKRYAFLVPAVCGNVTLSTIAMIPPPPAPVAQPPLAPAPPPVASAPVAAPAPPPVAPAPAAAPAPPPAAAPAPPPAPPVPAPVAAPTPRPAAPAPAPAADPVAGSRGSFLADVGVSREIDPANYLFARVGYEMPLADRLFLVGLVGGYARWMGNDGGSALTADAMLDYHWLDRISFGLGAGYWSGNDGQIDLIANLGFRISGPADGSNSSLFLDVRLPADDLGNSDKYGRYGLGVRFRL